MLTPRMEHLKQGVDLGEGAIVRLSAERNGVELTLSIMREVSKHLEAALT
jgi:hypothetical protein